VSTNFGNKVFAGEHFLENPKSDTNTSSLCLERMFNQIMFLFVY